MAGSEGGVSGGSSLQTQALILAHWMARQVRNLRCLGGPHCIIAFAAGGPDAFRALGT